MTHLEQYFLENGYITETEFYTHYDMNSVITMRERHGKYEFMYTHYNRENGYIITTRTELNAVWEWVQNGCPYYYLSFPF